VEARLVDPMVSMVVLMAFQFILDYNQVSLSAQGEGIFTSLCSAACERSGRLLRSRLAIPERREGLYVFQLDYPMPIGHCLSRVLQNVIFSPRKGFQGHDLLWGRGQHWFML